MTPIERNFSCDQSLKVQQRQESKNVKKNHILDYQTLAHLREMEDTMFEEAREAWDVLNQKDCLRVDGLTYEQINSRSDLKQELNRVRANAPIYQNWGNRRKTIFFKKLAVDYKQKLKQSYPSRQEMQLSENLSQTLEVTQAELCDMKKINKKIAKNYKARSSAYRYLLPVCQTSTTFSDLNPPKKVSFTCESEFKYFSKIEPSESILEQREYNYSTFDPK